MTSADQLPFGAETPDELLVAYANGSLAPAERAEVDRWLAAHPEWVARLRAYQAVGAAVRQSAATSAPPDIGSMAGLWAAIDVTPQPRPLRPAAAPAPAPAYAPTPGRGGMRAPKWLLAVAASIVVAVGAVSVVLVRDRDNTEVSLASRDDSADTTVAPGGTDPTDGGAPSGGSPAPGSGSAAAQALRAGAESTSEQDTAHTNFEATATVDLSGTELADLTNTDTAIVTVSGPGMVRFPDESVLDTTSTFEGGFFDLLPDEHASTVTKGDETYVSCEDAPYELEVEGQEGQCGALTFGTAFFGSDAGVNLLEQATDDVTTVGVEDIDGGPATHYQLEVDLADEGAEPEPATYDVWIGVDDGLIHQVTVTTASSMPLEWGDTTYDLPIALEMTYRLGQFGEPVDVPEVG